MSTVATEVEDRSRLVPTAGGRIFVRDLGPAETELPPVLLLHGLLVTSYAFRGLMFELATTRRVLAIDLPGCGESDRPLPDAARDYAVPWLADRVVELLTRLEVPQVDVVAHSFGGTVALLLSAEHPARVRRQVLADPVAFPMELPLEGKLAMLPRLGPYVFKTLYRRADLWRYLGSAFSTPELVDETAVNVYWDRLSRDGGREAAYAMLGHLTTLAWLRPRLSDVAAQTLVVWGDRDRLMPVSDGERLVELLPDATLAIVDGCGHAVPEERPQELLALAKTFFGPAA